MAKIFLCHAREDKPQVREVYQRLKAEGYEPWLDEENLLPGHPRFGHFYNPFVFNYMRWA